MSEIETELIDETPDTGIDEPEVESGADEPRTYAGKYSSVDELERGYGESTKAMTQAQQRTAELEAQLAEYEAAMNEPQPEAYDPYSALSGQLDEDTGNAWAAKLFRDPVATMTDALRPETINAFGPDLAERLYITWFGVQPLQASGWRARHEAQEQKQEIEQLRASFQQEQQQRQAENTQKSAAIAKDLILQSLPDFETYKDRIVQLFDQHSLPDDHPLLQTPEGMQEFTRQMYWIARGEEFERQQQAAGEPTPAKAAGAKARTQTRSSASGNGSTHDPVTQAYLDAVAASK